MRTRLLATALATLLVVALAGCSGDDPKPRYADPSSTPPSSPSSTPPSTPPTTTPPDEPESAKDFLRRWQDEAFDMQTSGDTTAYRAMTRRCADCDAYADQVDSIYKGGGAITAGPSKVKRIHKVGEVDMTLIYEFDVIAGSTQIRDAGGAVVQRLPGGLGRFQVNVEQFADDWKVLRISELVL